MPLNLFLFYKRQLNCKNVKKPNLLQLDNDLNHIFRKTLYIRDK